MYPGNTQTGYIYAKAGKCNTDRGIIVGNYSLTSSDNGCVVKIECEAYDGFEFDSIDSLITSKR